MKEVKGIITVLGDAAQVGRADRLTYSFIEVDGNIVARKLKVYLGLNGRLKQALSDGEPVTLYVSGAYLAGITMGNGKTYGTEVRGAGGMWFTFLVLLILGIPLSFGIIGLPLLWVAWTIWGEISVKNDAASLPNVIVV